MKVCLIGHTRGPQDEGMKNINLHLVNEFRESVPLLVLEPQECRLPKGLCKIRAFRPNIINYLQGPTIRSLVLCRFLRAAYPSAKIVLLAANPSLNGRWNKLLSILAPHLVLAITQDFRNQVARAGIPCTVVYPGVNQGIFKSVDELTKRKIRKSLGLPLDKKVVLQVGHCTEARGVRVLGDLQETLGDRVQFVAVSSASNRPQPAIVNSLRRKGVKIILDFLPRIEEVYQAADVYLFPGSRNDAAIDIPLSILEAMAVNLPVITTSFGGLPDIFAPAPWFRYVDSEKAMQSAIEDVLFREAVQSGTANMVSGFTWSAFARKILQAYESLDRADKTYTEVQT